ncbi:uncharacterized protein [Antedon mediterranea]|uniref:uncharacterized protein n=1 Tax=Antedon mediterranea TaxID=105859 RepID=UPI003AF9EAA4
MLALQTKSNIRLALETMTWTWSSQVNFELKVTPRLRKNLTMYIALLCILVFTPSIYGEDEAEVIDKVRAGVEAGNEIVNVFSDEHLSSQFSNDIAKFTKNIGPFLSAIGPVMALVSIFLPTSPSAELKLMKTEFQKIDEKFDKVFTKFQEVKNLIQETSLKAQYGQYEGEIYALSHRLQQFLDAPTDAIEGQKELFIAAYSVQIDSAILIIGRGMMEESTLSDNIPKTAITYTDRHRGKVQTIMKGIMNLILQGVKVHLAYLKVKDYNAAYEDEKTFWEDNIKKLADHMIDVDTRVKDVWKQQLLTDLNNNLALLNGKSNSDFADKFYAFLTEKYDWRHWHIVVYNDISGEDNHWVRFCGGYKSFRKHGGNTVVASCSKEEPGSSQSYARNALNTVEILAYRRRRFPLFPDPIQPPNNYGAEEIFNFLPADLRTGCTYAAVGIIRKNANVHHRAPSGRLSVVERGDYKLHAFD